MSQKQKAGARDWLRVAAHILHERGQLVSRYRSDMLRFSRRQDSGQARRRMCVDVTVIHCMIEDRPNALTEAVGSLDPPLIRHIRNDLYELAARDIRQPPSGKRGERVVPYALLDASLVVGVSQLWETPGKPAFSSLAERDGRAPTLQLRFASDGPRFGLTPRSECFGFSGALDVDVRAPAVSVPYVRCHVRNLPQRRAYSARNCCRPGSFWGGQQVTRKA